MAAHDELVTAGSFIEKFQKPVRDYFCYGFKEFSGRQYMQNGKAVPSESKQKEDRYRLTKVLETVDYIKWIVKKRRAIYSLTEKC